VSYAPRILLFPFVFLLGLAFAVNMKIAIALGVVSVLTTIVVHSVEAGFLAIMFCIPFDRLLILGAGGLTVTKIIILLTIGAWLLRSLLAHDAELLKMLYRRRTSLLIIGYLVMSVVSLVNAREFDDGVNLLIRRTSVIVLYFLVVNLVRDRRLLNLAINAIVIATGIVGILGMYEFFTGDQVLREVQTREELAVTQEGSQRIQGCAGNSNFHAAIMAMVLPLALIRAQQARGLRNRSFWYGLVLLLVINIFATNARLGMLGLILGVSGVLLLSDIRHKFTKLTFAAAVCGVVFGVLALFPEKVSTDRYTGDSGGKTVQYRVGWIKMSWEMVKKHPFLGVGVGNYFPEYNEYRRVAADLVPRERLKNHNGFMQVWAEMGTLGLIAFLAMLASIPLELISTTRHQQGDRELRQLRCGLLVAFAVYILMLGIIPVLEHEVAWVQIGLAMALGSIAPFATPPDAQTTPRVEGTV